MDPEGRSAPARPTRGGGPVTARPAPGGPVTVELAQFEPAERRQLSHALVRGQVRACVDLAGGPPRRAAAGTVREGLRTLQIALDDDAAAVELGPWHKDPVEGWRELTRLIEALDILAGGEADTTQVLVSRLRAELVARTGWTPYRPAPQRAESRRVRAAASPAASRTPAPSR